MYHEVVEANNSAALIGSDVAVRDHRRPSPYPDATSRRDKYSSAMYDPSPSRRCSGAAGGRDSRGRRRARALRAEAGALDFRSLYKQPLGRYYFLMYVRDDARAGDFLLGVGRYRSSRLEARVARACSTATRPR